MILLAAAVMVTAATGVAAANQQDSDTPITGPALEQASEAALNHIGEGTVTETEVGDEESMYEVEVTLADGTQIDVQLDEEFHVVGTESDGPDDDDDDDGPDHDDDDGPDDDGPDDDDDD